MDTPTNSNSIIERIAAEHIQPKKAWGFWVGNAALWAVGTVMVFVGAIATAIAIHMVRTQDWGLFSQGSGNLAEFAIKSLPYFWIIIFVLFILLAELVLRHTKRGYRWTIGMLVPSVIGISIMVGYCAYALGLGKTIDTSLEEHVGVYGRLLVPRHSAWIAPDHGRLAGKVIGLDTSARFTIITIDGQQWLVEAGSADFVDDDDVLAVNVRVRMIGHVTASHGFRADVVLIQPDDEPFGRPGLHSRPPLPRERE